MYASRGRHLCFTQPRHGCFTQPGVWLESPVSMVHWTERDREFLRLALALAAKGEGFVEPNPMVGCVIVKGGRIVGTGYHRHFGGPHAERVALRRAGSLARGSCAYVTLEPCNHFGKTPPCAEALVRAGVTRVVVAIRDPNPMVAGRGIRRLRAAGVRVDLGLLRAEAMALAAPFVKIHREHRPYVILKWAQSIDGKIATWTGDSQWITSRASRAAGHALRGRVDAVIVGVGTVLSDDPMLTARLARPRRQAVRVVLDTNLRTPPGAKLVKTARRVPTLIVTSKCQNVETSKRQNVEMSKSQKVKKSKRQNVVRLLRRRRRMLERAGCEICEVDRERHGLNLVRLLDFLHGRGATNVLVEGGGEVLGSFVRAGLADEARVFVAPRLIGGHEAPGPLGQDGPAMMGDITGTRVARIFTLGPDLCYNLRFRREG